MDNVDWMKSNINILPKWIKIEQSQNPNDVNRNMINKIYTKRVTTFSYIIYHVILLMPRETIYINAYIPNYYSSVQISFDMLVLKFFDPISKRQFFLFLKHTHEPSHPVIESEQSVIRRVLTWRIINVILFNASNLRITEKIFVP